MDCARCRDKASPADSHRRHNFPGREGTADLPCVLPNGPSRRFQVMFYTPFLCSSIAHFFSRVLICLHDVYVPGAATQVAGDRVTDFIVRRVVVRAEKSETRHQHSGCAKAALQTVFLKESVLQWMQFPVLFESFDRRDRASISLNSERRTRLERASVHHNCTRAAVTRVTTDVRACQSQSFAEEMDEQHSWFDEGAVLDTVDCHFDCRHR